jgi:thioredoxin-like negative regulator of GroEL
VIVVAVAMPRFGCLHVLALIAAQASLCGAVPAHDEAVLDIITQYNHDRVLDGSRTVLVAFVHPALPRSARLQPLLHALRATLQDDPTVRVAFVDLSVERLLASKYAIRETPTLLVFPRRLPR